MRIKISADSTCDLPEDILEKYDIGISPLYIVRNGESLRDGIDITPDDIYEHVRSGGMMCSTAAVNYADYLEFFGKYLEDYDAVIHFTISSSMSACYQNACLAAQALGNVYAVDSESLTVGIGLLAMRASELAADGLSPDEIVAYVNAMKTRVDTSFLLDTLDYLHKGGRCSSIAALGANLLHLRPCIEVTGGAMDVGKKYRGAIDKCITRYIADRLAIGQFDRRRVFVADSGLDKTIRASAIRQVADTGLFDEVLWARAGCTISNHCGPNTLGLVLVQK
ncbi:MAG: DegV family protein [Oscillospiraceae bacterium]